MPSISSRSASASVSHESGGRAQRADDVERDAGGRAGRVDRHVGRVLERLEALRPDPARLRAPRARSSPASRRTRRRDTPPPAPRPRSTHGRKLAGARSGKTSARFVMSPFGSRTSAGIPASSASSSSTTARPVLPEPVMPTTTPCVVRSLEPDDDLVGSRLPGLRVDRVARGGRSRGRPSPRSLESRPMLDGLRVEPGTPPRIAERDPGDRLGLDKDDGEKRLDAARRADRRAPVPPLRRGPAKRPARPPGTRRVGEGRRRPARVRRASTRPA